jgi:hypothetical protein
MVGTSEKHHVKTGFWTEHASNSQCNHSDFSPSLAYLIAESYILVTEQQSSVIIVVVAMMLWLSLLRSYTLVTRASLYLSSRLATQTRKQTQGIAMQNLSTSAHVAGVTNRVLMEEPSPERVLWRILKDYVCVVRIQLPTPATSSQSRDGFHRRWIGAVTTFRERPVATSALVLLGAMYFGLAIGYQLIAVFTSRIVHHNIVRSNYEKSGAWFPEIRDPAHMINTSIFPVVTDFQTGMLSKAVAYAENCYRKDASESECSLFYRPSIDYVERHNASCPFAKHMCPGAMESAYELDTEWVDAGILGINDKHACQFRMRKTCSPLATDEHVRSRPFDNEGSMLVEYRYGDGLGTVWQGNKTLEEIVTDPDPDPDPRRRPPRDIPHYLIR